MEYMGFGYKNKLKCFIVNIYSPCTLSGKRKLWADLRMTKEGFGKGIWCLAGDFNAVLKNRERRGASSQEHRTRKLQNSSVWSETWNCLTYQCLVDDSLGLKQMALQ